jgi:hypothetical protein
MEFLACLGQIAENRLPIGEDKQVADPFGMGVVETCSFNGRQDGLDPSFHPEGGRGIPGGGKIPEIDIGSAAEFAVVDDMAILDHRDRLGVDPRSREDGPRIQTAGLSVHPVIGRDDQIHVRNGVHDFADQPVDFADVPAGRFGVGRVVWVTKAVVLIYRKSGLSVRSISRPARRSQWFTSIV